MKEGLAHEQAGNVAAAMETYKKGLKNFGPQTSKSYDEHFITEAFFKVSYCIHEARDGAKLINFKVLFLFFSVPII